MSDAQILTQTPMGNWHGHYGTENEAKRKGICGTISTVKPQYKLSADLPDNPVMTELRSHARWVAWTYELRNGRWAKLPKNPATGRNASVSDPATWGGYEEARECQVCNGFAGVGFVLNGDGICGGDLDHCLDWSGELPCETYAEYSPSGEGVRLLLSGNDIQTLKCDAAGVEVYTKGRFLTITGNHVPGTPLAINEAPATIAALKARVDTYKGAEAPKQPAQPLSVLAAPKAPKSQQGHSSGFWRAVNEAALTDLDAWVPTLLPMAVKQATGGWRVTSQDLGRNLEEDLSIHPDGIQDFGPEQAATAVDLVAQNRGMGAKDAAFWLCDMLRISPASLGWSEKGAPQPFAFIPPDAPVPIHATPFVWRDPATLPARQWLYGRHLIRRFVSVTVAPGGVGKSSLTIAEAVAMASGRYLLGEWVAEPMRVWVLNLEDPRDELERRIAATMLHHGIAPEAMAERLFVDSGRERGLCTASQTREGVTINAPEVEALVAEIRARNIDVLIVDPFVSSHRVNENDNGAIDVVAKEWGRVAERCNCAIELVHHTRKLGGTEASSEASRGAVALLGAARSARVLNRMTDAQKAEAGVSGDPATYFSVDRDKANLAPPGKRLWRRMASVDLANGDQVGVAEEWEWPDDSDGLSTKDLLAVQNAISAAWDEGKPPRASNQVKEGWAGEIVAEVLGLDAVKNKARISRLLKKWVKNGALREVKHGDEKRNLRPCLEVGEWATE